MISAFTAQLLRQARAAQAKATAKTSVAAPNVIQSIRDLQQRSKAITSVPLTQSPVGTPVAYSPDAPASVSNTGNTGVAPLALTSGVQPDIADAATSTGSQAENSKSLIQIIFVAALIWVGWGYLEKRK